MTYVDVTDHSVVGDGSTDNSNNLQTADNAAGKHPLYFPDGTYVTDAYIPESPVFGVGSLKVWNSSQNEYDTIALDPVAATYLAQVQPGEQDQYVNIQIGPEAGNENNYTGYANVFIGYRAAAEQHGGSRSVAVGSRAAQFVDDPYSITALGADALAYAKYGARSEAIGANAMKWTGADDPVAMGHNWFSDRRGNYIKSSPSVGDINYRWDDIDTFLGDASNPNPAHLPANNGDVTGNTGMGRNVLHHMIKGEDNVAIGRNSMTHAFDASNNVAIGRNSLRNGVNIQGNTAVGEGAGLQSSSAHENVFVGRYSGWAIRHSYGNTLIGYEAGMYLDDEATGPYSSGGVRRNVGVGYGALRDAKGVALATAVGQWAMKDAQGVGSSAFGTNALQAGGNTGDTAIGNSSLRHLNRGEFNTALGFNAGRYLGGKELSSAKNITCIGAFSEITSSHQVQLGDSRTTTYAYGAVQNRSDRRDKADITDTDLGLEFLLRHKPRKHRWDYREDYYEKDEDGEIVNVLDKDGSKKRKRFHQSFVAQEVKEICDELGVDFGGLQHHAYDGEGADVWSLGYEEYVPVIVNAIQELAEKMND